MTATKRSTMNVVQVSEEKRSPNARAVRVFTTDWDMDDTGWSALETGFYLGRMLESLRQPDEDIVACAERLHAQGLRP